MNIIFDTNIIRRDIRLQDKNNEIIHDYLSKTNSSIILPKIVIQEISSLYKRLLIERNNEFIKSSRNINTLLDKKVVDIELSLDIDDEVEKYINYLKSSLKISAENIIDYKSDYLNDIITRACERKKPFDENGKGFRDALIWLSILDFAEIIEDRKVIFISNNHKDFSESKMNLLHPDLIEETRLRNVEILYYISINDFIKEHAKKITFITKEWINVNVDNNKIEELFNRLIESYQDNLHERISDSLDEDKKTTDYIGPLDIFNSNLEEFYVYEMSDGTLLLYLTYELEKEYEYEFEHKVEEEHDKLDYSFEYDPSTDDMEMVPIYKPSFCISSL